jgi:hypothetical protein
MVDVRACSQHSSNLQQRHITPRTYTDVCIVVEYSSTMQCTSHVTNQTTGVTLNMLIILHTLNALE